MSLTAPVEKDGFSYAGGDLYCETSGRNRHRRATVPELKAHFKGKDKEDRPAHWYEAQLIHYGLPPSKVKGTAHKRLFDAVNKGGLSVPSNIAKIENDLKKDWTKKERETKKVLEESAARKSTAAAKGTKRKAPQARAPTITINTTYTISGPSIIQDGPPAAKRAKTTKSTPAKKTAKKNETTTPKATKAKAAPKPATKTTGQRAGPSRPTSATASSSRSVNQGYDEPPPPYSELPDFDRNNDAPASSGQGARSQWSSPLPKLGLLNGRYEVTCTQIENNHHGHMDLNLIATIDGNTLWMTFDFGEFTGMMSLPRPWDSSRDKHMFHWRGRSDAGEPYHMDEEFLDCNYLVFRGNGNIDGCIACHEYETIYFTAFRLPGQGTASPVTRDEARDEWNALGSSFW